MTPKKMKKTTTRKTQPVRSGAVMMGALLATTTFGAREAVAASVTRPTGRATTIESLLRPKTPYEAVIADILRTMRATNAAASAQTPASQQFNIAPGPLGVAIASFEALTGISVTLADATRDLHSPGATGLLTPEQALQRLLGGTGLVHRFTGSTTVRIEVGGRTERVEVTGWATPTIESPKFTAPLVDTPQSIAVIPGSVFNQQGAQNLTEVLRNTPGITFDAGENGFSTGTSNFGIRGFDSSGSIFVDGARDSGNYFRDTFNVEQVEIAKGPAGDNGRSSAGGYVNLSTKAPRVESFQHSTIGYGVNNRPRLTLDVNQAVGNQTAVRFNALWQDADVAGRDVTKTSSWGLAPSIAVGLNGPTRLDLSYQHIEQDNIPDWGLPGAVLEGLSTYHEASGGAANRSQFYGHATDYDNVKSDAVLARVEHTFSPSLRLSNQTRWANTEREALYTAPTGFTPATRVVLSQRQAYSRDNSSLANHTNLSSSFETGSLPHALAAGLEVSRETSVAGRYATNNALGNIGNAAPVTPVDDPDPNRTLADFPGLVPFQTADVTINTVAAYLYDTVQFSPQWQLNAGVRLERYDVRIDSKTAAGAPQGPDGYNRTDTTASGKIGLVYKPTEDGSFYGAVGVAALPPASYLSNPDISRDGDNAFPGWTAGQNSATSKVQRSTNYEVGTKWNLFDERLSASAAIFRTLRTNIAQAGTVDGVANTFVGYGRQIVQGVEFGASGQVTPGWSVFGGLLFMSSERLHSPEVDAARLAANFTDYNNPNDPTNNVTTTNGDELAFTPRVSANLWTTYLLPGGLTIGGGARHVGSSYIGRPDNAERIIANSRYGKVPGYTVLDLIAIYEVNQRLNLRFNLDNATNEFYAMSVNWNGNRFTPGPARAFVLSADVKF